jgi:hypothetical protein
MRYGSVFAVIAIIAFALALIFSLIGGPVAQYVVTAELAGLIAVACHLAARSDWGWAGQDRGRRQG